MARYYIKSGIDVQNLYDTVNSLTGIGADGSASTITYDAPVQFTGDVTLGNVNITGAMNAADGIKTSSDIIVYNASGSSVIALRSSDGWMLANGSSFAGDVIATGCVWCNHGKNDRSISASYDIYTSRNIEADGSVSGAGNITATNSITTTNGSIYATNGNIYASNGTVQGKHLYANGGTVYATAGSVINDIIARKFSAGAGLNGIAFWSSSGNYYSETGTFTTTSGSFTTTSGNLTTSSGNLQVGGTAKISGAATVLGNIRADSSTLYAGATSVKSDVIARCFITQHGNEKGYVFTSDDGTISTGGKVEASSVYGTNGLYGNLYGGWLCSNNGEYYLSVQDDGNLVFYRKNLSTGAIKSVWSISGSSISV